jgi:hypothetical protein
MDYEGLFEFAQQVASYLDGWQLLDPQPFNHAACLGGPDGAGLTVGVNGFDDFCQDARVEISGRWPEAAIINQSTTTFYPRGESASIKAAMKRGPKAVAGDIKRRLLPKYLPLYAEMKERREHYLAREAKRRKRLEQLAEASGGELGRVVGKLRLDTPGGGWGYAEVGVYDDGEMVSFELHSVPFEKALELVRVLIEGGSKRNDEGIHSASV